MFHKQKRSMKISILEGYNDVRLWGKFRFISGFGILNLESPVEFSFESAGDEVGMLILEGRCDISVDGKEYKGLGQRGSVFGGRPTGVYIPINSKFSIKGEKAKIAVCKARCNKKTEAAVILPQEVKAIEAGRDNWKREVRLIIGQDSPSVNLILGETINPAGNWSGIPPAKHEKDDLPNESLHEELYYFKTDKPQGWGVERVYSPERKINELVYLKNDTVTFMPWGYHEVVAAPGYPLYYLFFLGGKGNKLAAWEDREHNWIKGIQSEVK